MRDTIQKPSNKNYVHLQTILTKMIITHSYKWDTPKLQQQQPKLLQLTPIQAAGDLYKIKQINDILMSSFQVQKMHHIHCSVLLFDNTKTNFPNYLFFG
jgi:hypothetical protein